MGISWLTNAICFFSNDPSFQHPDARSARSQTSTARSMLSSWVQNQWTSCTCRCWKMRHTMDAMDAMDGLMPRWKTTYFLTVSFLQICSSHYDNQVLKLVASLVIGTLRAFFSTPRTTQVPGWAPYLLLVENSCAPPIFWWFKKHPFMLCHWRWRILGDDEM